MSNSTTGQLQASGGTTTYTNDVNNQGEIRTDLGSTSVFEAAVTGDGTFTGPGTTEFQNVFAPGNSPAIIALEGDVEFTPTATLQTELAGTMTGEFDSLAIDGDAMLAGTLEVSLLGGFDPQFGDTF